MNNATEEPMNRDNFRGNLLGRNYTIQQNEDGYFFLNYADPDQDQQELLNSLQFKRYKSKNITKLERKIQNLLLKRTSLNTKKNKGNSRPTKENFNKAYANWQNIQNSPYPLTNNEKQRSNNLERIINAFEQQNNQGNNQGNKNQKNRNIMVSKEKIGNNIYRNRNPPYQTYRYNKNTNKYIPIENNSLLSKKNINLLQFPKKNNNQTKTNKDILQQPIPEKVNLNQALEEMKSPTSVQSSPLKTGLVGNQSLIPSLERSNSVMKEITEPTPTRAPSQLGYPTRTGTPYEQTNSTPIPTQTIQPLQTIKENSNNNSTKQNTGTGTATPLEQTASQTTETSPIHSPNSAFKKVNGSSKINKKVRISNNTTQQGGKRRTHKKRKHAKKHKTRGRKH